RGARGGARGSADGRPAGTRATPGRGEERVTAPTVADLARRDPFWKVRADPRRADLELGTRADVLPYFVPIGSPLGREVVVDGAPRLMFGSNNYLGLADDPRVMEAARAAVDRYGTGCTGSRLMNGTLELHLEL